MDNREIIIKDDSKLIISLSYINYKRLLKAVNHWEKNKEKNRLKYVPKNGCRRKHSPKIAFEIISLPETEDDAAVVQISIIYTHYNQLMKVLDRYNKQVEAKRLSYKPKRGVNVPRHQPVSFDRVVLCG